MDCIRVNLKNAGHFFPIYISLDQNVIYTAGKSLSVVMWPWFRKWKTFALPIWRLELIVNKIKQSYPRKRDLAPLKFCFSRHSQQGKGDMRFNKAGAKSKNRLQIIGTPRESDNIRTHNFLLRETKEKWTPNLHFKNCFTNTCLRAWKRVKSSTFRFVCLTLSELVRVWVCLFIYRSHYIFRVASIYVFFPSLQNYNYVGVPVSNF